MDQYIEVSGNKVSLQLRIFHLIEDKYYIIYCPALEVTGYGTDTDEALISFEHNLQVFFEDYVVQADKLFEYLESMGWKFQGKKYHRDIGVDDFMKNLPMHILDQTEYQKSNLYA